MSKCVCIDIGGTNLKMSCADDNLDLSRNKSIKTPADYGRILSEIASYMQQEECSIAGICIPGTYSHATDRVLYCPNLTALNEKDIRGDLRRKYGIDSVVDNDANLAALGEYEKCEKNKINSMILITLGTGVGGGFISKGAPYEERLSPFEAGHITVDYTGRMCGCGRQGCLEAYCSVSGLLRTYKELAPTEHTNTVGGLERLWRKDDNIAKLTFEAYSGSLAHGLASMANLMLPEKIKIGGGLSEISDIFLNTVIQQFSKLIYPAYKQMVTIETAELKNKAGMVGAAALVQKRSSDRA